MYCQRAYNHRRLYGFAVRKYVTSSNSASLSLPSLDLEQLLEKSSRNNNDRESDFVVIGGGSAGISASNALARFGHSVAIFDYVAPSPTRSTRWGFGGTCCNVGCIPKKLFHSAGTLRKTMADLGPAFGLTTAESNRLEFDWNTLVGTVQNYAKSLSFHYSSGLNPNVELIRSESGILSRSEGLGVFYFDRFGERCVHKAKIGIVVATGGRPNIPSDADCLGARKYAITSDDLFSLRNPPGKTLCVGGGYVAIECAGFLSDLGFDVSMAVRSNFLRSAGFDQQCAKKVREMLSCEGVKVNMKTIPIEIRPAQDRKFLQVKLKNVENGTIWEERFETVLFGTGRSADFSTLNLENAGVQVSRNGKISVDERYSTSREGIYAIGDIANSGFPELTPVAIRQGEILARNIASSESSDLLINSDAPIPELLEPLMVPSTVFGPVEYGRIGLSELEACQHYGTKNVDTWLKEWQPLEISAAVSANLSSSSTQKPYPCLIKLVCLPSNENKVVGLHYVGPNAGEIVQGFSMAINMGARKSDFDKRSIGIHPTNAEAFLDLSVTRSSGENWVNLGGCGGGRCG